METPSMHETPEDLHELQQLLDASYEAAGEHLRSIFRPERRMSAAETAAHLKGVFVLNVATVTAACGNGNSESCGSFASTRPCASEECVTANLFTDCRRPASNWIANRFPKWPCRIRKRLTRSWMK